MTKLASHLHEHVYPKTLMRRPRLIRWLYAWNGLVLQRNWAVKRALRHLLPGLPPGSVVIDAGCGEGLHLLPWAGRFPQLHFTGIDRLEGHLDFGRRYVAVSGLANVSFQLSELENFRAEKKAGLLTCIGVMQYIEADERVLKNISRALSDGGLAIVYVPINGRMILPPYRYFFGKKMHYERSQKRVRVYAKEEFFAKLETAGMEVKSCRFTYGTLGILGHELYSLLLMGMGNSGRAAWLFGLLLAAFLPVVLILKWVDFLWEKKDGNGMLVMAKKKESGVRPELAF